MTNDASAPALHTPSLQRAGSCAWIVCGSLHPEQVNQVLNDLCVKRVTRKTETCIAQQVRWASAPFANARTNADKRKIACAAAEVANENKLIMIQRGFIVVRGGNGL